MILLAVLGALLTILAAGFGALMLIRPRESRVGIPSAFALSWLFGVGIVSLLVWLVGFFVKGAMLPGIVGLICVSLPLFARKIAGWSSLAFEPLRKPGRVELALGAILAVEVATIFYLSYVHTLGGDGILNWEIKARYAYSNAGILPASYLQDTGRAFSHPEYPLAIPYTELWLYFWVGDTNQFWAKTIFPLFYLTGVILLTSVVARLTEKVWAGLVGSILLFFVPQVSVGAGSVIVGYVDFPMAVFYLATIGYLLCACRSDDRGSFAIYAACLALLPWVKREGAILWFVAAGCGAFLILSRKKSLIHFLALLPGIFVILAWRIYLARMHAITSSDFSALALPVLRTNMHRLGTIASELASEFTDMEKWSLLWAMAIVAAGFLIRQYRGSRTVVLFTAILVPIGIYSFSYTFSAWPNYVAHLQLSVSRLLVHVAPLAVLLVAVALPPQRWRSESAHFKV
jgi:hypothetical protein